MTIDDFRVLGFDIYSHNGDERARKVYATNDTSVEVRFLNIGDGSWNCEVWNFGEDGEEEGGAALPYKFEWKCDVLMLMQAIESPRIIVW